MKRPLLDQLRRERKQNPQLIFTLDAFEKWCAKAGFGDSEAVLKLLQEAGGSYRIQSARIKLFIKERS